MIAVTTTETATAVRKPPRLQTQHLALLIACFPAILIVGFLVATVWLSFGGLPGTSDAPISLDYWRAVFSSRTVSTMAWNTLSFSLQSMAWGLLLGVGIAWLVHRTDVGGRGLVYALITIGILMPGFFSAMAYMYLFHPRIGTVNYLLQHWTGDRSVALNVISVTGMAAVQGLTMSPIAFVLTAGNIVNIDGSLEAAARVHGAGAFATFRRVTLPIVKAAVLGAAFYIVAISVATLDVPLIIGLQDRILVFSTYLYVQTQSVEGTEQYSIAAAFATVLIVMALVLSWAYTRVISNARRFEVISGKAQPAQPVRLVGWLWPARILLAVYLGAVVVVPIVVLIWISFLPYLQPVTQFAIASASLDNYRDLPWSLILRGVGNTLLLALFAPALAVALSLVYSWLVLRSRFRFRAAFDYIAFLPHAVPNVIFAFVALLIVVRYRPLGLDLYGSVAILVILYVIVMLSFATRISNAALIQVSREMEEASLVSGATMATTIRRIILKLIAPSLLMAWVWLVMVVFRELTIATLLLSRENITLPVVTWTSWATGQQTTAAAVTVIMMAAMAPIIVFFMVRFGNAIQAQTGSSTNRGKQD